MRSRQMARRSRSPATSTKCLRVHTNNEIFLVPTAGGTPKKISTSPGSDSTPLYSPDGKWIAWRMQKRPGYESDRFRLVIYNRQTGEIRNLTEGFDYWVGSFAWSTTRRAYFSLPKDRARPLSISVSWKFSTMETGIDVTIKKTDVDMQEIARGFFDSPVISLDGQDSVCRLHVDQCAE